jgi:cytochrome c peroxidase
VKRHFILYFCLLAVFISIAFKNSPNQNAYEKLYLQKLHAFKGQQTALLTLVNKSNLESSLELEKLKEQISTARKDLKAMDIWLRYLEPVAYKKINGPLPVEWETEVFEKFEKPYKREGAGLTLAELYLEEEKPDKKVLASLIQSSLDVFPVYEADSITGELKDYSHFFLCNRLFLLNLASLYTTGFECPDTSHVIPELNSMLQEVGGIYQVFNQSYPEHPLPLDFLTRYEKMRAFVATQPTRYSHFDHFSFIKDYVNPLFAQNQELIRKYQVLSKSYVDYALNKNATSIFGKDLYNGQNVNGVFHRVTDKEVLSEIDKVGKLLFFDPILSGNNQRSCASCHKPTEYFTDTLSSTSLQFDHQSALPRNTPTLINVGFNHLIMMDGKHTSLQDQTKAVILNPLEMGSKEEEVLKKVLDCPEYNKAFKKLLVHTPEEKEITFDHIASAITLYYSKFSRYTAPFDEAMENKQVLNVSAKRGFNMFMSKSQCATCHFVPQFNGVKPPFVNSEFEVIGVPSKNSSKTLSPDRGRHSIHPAEETLNAFRTGSLRNSAFTKPYMHNGALASLEEVVDFYDVGGGVGKGLDVPNQTLSSDSLHLSKKEKEDLIYFLNSLNEKIVFETPPVRLPASKIKASNERVVGGTY